MSTTPKPAQPARQPAREALERRAFPFELDEVRDAEGGRSSDFTIRGHAAVFNTWYDLGYFRERVAKGAFDEVLADDPHVLHLWDHDTSKALSSTRSNPVTLELRTDPKGLHFWSKVDGELSYAQDLRRLLDRGIVNQSSFAFTVAQDEWVIREEDGEEVIERTILKVAELFDVTTTAMGASPTTDSQLAMRTREKARALAEQGLPEPASGGAAAPPEGEAGQTTETPPADGGAASEDDPTAQGSPAARGRADLLVLKRQAAKDREEAKQAQAQIDRDLHR